MHVSSEWLSIRRKLPLLISALLCAVVAALSWASYRRLEGALVIAAGDRVMNVAQRLAGMLDESARRLRGDVRQVSADSAGVKFVVGPTDRKGAVHVGVHRRRRHASRHSRSTHRVPREAVHARAADQQGASNPRWLRTQFVRGDP